MKTWSGVIERVFERDYNGTKLYSFRIKGVDRWFKTGKTALDFKEGDAIRFDEKNSQVMIDTLVEAKDLTPSAGSTEGTESVASGATAPTVGQRMAWESARRDATNIVVAALHTDALPWAKNTAKAKKLDLLVGYVNQVARQLLEPQEEDK